jgi:hypothetical protein
MCEITKRADSGCEIKKVSQSHNTTMEAHRGEEV